jgi:hypothetical protein
MTPIGAGTTTLPGAWQRPGAAGRARTPFWKTYRNFLTVVDHYKVQIQISHVRQPNRHSVALDETAKLKIRHYVEQIKLVIDSSHLTQDKKEALYDKVNAFLAGVDSDRTKLEKFTDLVIKLAHTGGEVAEELEPARKWIDSIARLLGFAQESESTQRALPSTKVRKLKHQRQLPKPAPRRDDLDDEIPF